MRSSRASLTLAFGVALLASLAFIIAACGGLVSNTAEQLATAIPVNDPPRPLVTVQFCNDVGTSYPSQDFKNANALVAKSLKNAVVANQAGVDLYATAMDHDPLATTNTLAPFIIPATMAYPPTPTLIPTSTNNNLFSKNATQTAIANSNNSGVIHYNQTVTAAQNALGTPQAQVAQDTQRLTTWSPPSDSAPSSVWGCMQLANNNFKNQTGIKLLWIASNLDNMTTACGDCTAALTNRQGLAGVIVHVIYFASASGSEDHTKRTFWCPLFRQAGVKAVVFSTEPQSGTISNLLTQDVQQGPTGCPGT